MPLIHFLRFVQAALTAARTLFTRLGDGQLSAEQEAAVGAHAKKHVAAARLVGPLSPPSSVDVPDEAPAEGHGCRPASWIGYGFELHASALDAATESGLSPQSKAALMAARSLASRGDRDANEPLRLWEPSSPGQASQRSLLVGGVRDPIASSAAAMEGLAHVRKKLEAAPGGPQTNSSKVALEKLVVAQELLNTVPSTTATLKKLTLAQELLETMPSSDRAVATLAARETLAVARQLLETQPVYSHSKLRLTLEGLALAQQLLDTQLVKSQAARADVLSDSLQLTRQLLDTQPVGLKEPEAYTALERLALVQQRLETHAVGADLEVELAVKELVLVQQQLQTQPIYANARRAEAWMQGLALGRQLLEAPAIGAERTELYGLVLARELLGTHTDQSNAAVAFGHLTESQRLLGTSAAHTQLQSDELRQGLVLVRQLLETHHLYPDKTGAALNALGLVQQLLTTQPAVPTREKSASFPPQPPRFSKGSSMSFRADTFDASEERALLRHVQWALAHDPHVGSALAADPSATAFYTLVSEGVLLAKFVQHVDAGALDSRALNLPSADAPVPQPARLQNHALTTNAATAIGCGVRGLTPQQLASARDNTQLVLGLLWKLTAAELLSRLSAHPLSAELQYLNAADGAPASSGKRAPAELLVSWLNHHAAAY
eukprot:912495-Prymnesium_polylepis.1